MLNQRAKKSHYLYHTILFFLFFILWPRVCQFTDEIVGKTRDVLVKARGYKQETVPTRSHCRFFITGARKCISKRSLPPRIANHPSLLIASISFSPLIHTLLPLHYWYLLSFTFQIYQYLTTNNTIIIYCSWIYCNHIIVKRNHSITTLIRWCSISIKQLLPR